jgi:hypothetical protein
MYSFPFLHLELASLILQPLLPSLHPIAGNWFSFSKGIEALRLDFTNQPQVPRVPWPQHQAKSPVLLPRLCKLVICKKFPVPYISIITKIQKGFD